MKLGKVECSRFYKRKMRKRDEKKKKETVAFSGKKDLIPLLRADTRAQLRTPGMARSSALQKTKTKKKR